MKDDTMTTSGLQLSPQNKFILLIFIFAIILLNIGFLLKAYSGFTANDGMPGSVGNLEIYLLYSYLIISIVFLSYLMVTIKNNQFKRNCLFHFFSFSPAIFFIYSVYRVTGLYGLFSKEFISSLDWFTMSAIILPFFSFLLFLVKKNEGSEN